MSMTKLTTDLDIIQKLDDEPNDVTGLTAAQVKAKFDESGNDIKTFINDILTAEIDLLAAGVISVIGIPTLSGTNVQDVLESIKLRIDAIAVANVNAEVANTHVGADARTYTSLSDRFDTIDITDAGKALQSDLLITNAAIVTTNAALALLDTNTFKIADWTSGTGWKKLPNGLIIQWGSGTTGADTQNTPTLFYSTSSVIFPIPFPVSCLLVITNQANNIAMWQTRSINTKTTSAINFSGTDNNTSYKPFTYITIGF